MARGFIEVDGRQVDALLVDLTGAPGRVQRNAREGTVRGARRIDKEMTVDATGHTGSYFGRKKYAITDLPKHVTHELITPLEAEIGIEYKGQGKLAHIIAKGSVNNAPAYDYMAGPTRAMPGVANDYADLAEKSVLGENE